MVWLVVGAGVVAIVLAVLMSRARVPHDGVDNFRRQIDALSPEARRPVVGRVNEARDAQRDDDLKPRPTTSVTPAKGIDRGDDRAAGPRYEIDDGPAPRYEIDDEHGPGAQSGGVEDRDDVDQIDAVDQIDDGDELGTADDAFDRDAVSDDGDSDDDADVNGADVNGAGVNDEGDESADPAETESGPDSDDGEASADGP